MGNYKSQVESEDYMAEGIWNDLGEAVQGRVIAEKKLTILESFLLDLRDNWDCDSGANGTHPNHCRTCHAKELLKSII